MNNKEFTLIWVDKNEEGSYNLINPKNLYGMNLDKALGSLKWTKSILGKDYPCFIYDPSEMSLFNNNKQDKNVIELLLGIIK